MNKLITLLFFSYFLFSCGTPSVQDKSEKNLDAFQFLIGKWEGQRDGMTLQEIWKKGDDSFMEGEGSVFSESDTLFHEKLKLEILEGEIFYVATTPKNKIPVSFKLVSTEHNRWNFENKEHDFPQEILYHFVEPDSLHVTIQGNDNGKISKEEFFFKKIN